LWVGGGVVFGPSPRDYSIKLPKKLKRLALKSSLSTKAQNDDIIVIDKLELEEIKTKRMVQLLKDLDVDETALIVLNGKDENNDKVVLSSRNIEGVSTAYVNTINVYDILRHSKFIITKDALSKVSEVYA
jgi:large subunit ribosomal protein L4